MVHLLAFSCHLARRHEVELEPSSPSRTLRVCVFPRADAEPQPGTLQVVLTLAVTLPPCL